ncbi:aminoacyl-tRNA hydrolase [Lyngbya confervoides]|uniref:Peptidyl-tRNA hydrolase n=1 Tax=Lyngbya confervoides BDU141951 TaxID=1574623 RepID=A0ABD4T255_9CYAN|nr:aminoacyl-tRNA hydrolase [Lyngbya confervoides]MCM1982734.1 aminoacyl-tRNA hydrolase [Lyngbya confervoides BDU141951]
MEQQTPLLVVGLGNPGQKYEKTRHNVGFEVVDLLAQRWGIALREERRLKGQWGQGQGPAGQPLALLKPTTYMNRSGAAVRAVLDWYKWPAQSVLAVYDDMDLPLGRLRLRLSGSAGGHNGMRSLISCLGTQDFPRLRLGIDSPKCPRVTDADTVSYVLGRFTAAEQGIVTEILARAADAVECALQQGVPKAMNRYNQQITTHP